MAWFYLIVAGLFEISWAIGLKYTEGFTRLLPSLGTIASMILSIVLLGLALKTLPVGTAYAVWTGIGAVGTAALGIYLFAEPATALRLICIGLILCGSWVSSWSRRLRAPPKSPASPRWRKPRRGIAAQPRLARSSLEWPGLFRPTSPFLPVLLPR
jgi:quaternary ammonium compound-resistance protein SugE